MKYLFTLLFTFFAYTIYGQTVDFSFQTPGGSYCVPAQVSFTQQSSPGAVGFIWDFGDGGSGNGPNITHTFTRAGVFTVRLTAIFEKRAIVVSKQVNINPANRVNISVDRKYICQPGNIAFTATATGNQNFDWDFGDNNTTSTTVNTTSHLYGDFGNYNATVRATNGNGCEATATVAVEVKKALVTASHSSVNYCVNNTVRFNASAVIPANTTVSSYTWDFGDGNVTTTNTSTVNHQYLNKAEYKPKVSIVTSEGCTSDLDIASVFIGVPTSVSSASPVNPSVCGSDTAFFNVTSSDAFRYVWEFGDGDSLHSPLNQVGHKYHQLGVHNVTVIPYDDFGCGGAPVTFPVDIIGVIATYNFNEDCSSPGKIDFTNTSPGNVTSFLWNFDDGSLDNSNPNPSHVFAPNSLYDIKLRVDDAVTGCSDTLQKRIYTTPNGFFNRDSTLCRNEGTIYSVKNDNKNPASLYTYFVGGTRIGPAASSALSFYPKQMGLFSDYVVIDNGAGFCVDTVSLDHQILVRGPQLNFDINSSICTYDSTVIVNNTSPFIASDTINSITWKADDSLFSQSYQPPSYKFTNVGNHKIILYASDINGCQDSLMKPVVVNPIPFLRVIPERDTICAEQPDTLIAFHNAPIVWSSPQPLNCNTCDTLVMAHDGDTYFAVEARTLAGCYSRDTINLRVYPRFNAVAVNPLSLICQGDTVSLRVAPEEMNVAWFPSIGLSNISGYNPVASPLQTTTYKAVLTDSAGCFSDSAFFDVRVKSAPIVDAGPDKTVPYYSNFTLQPTYGSNITQYLWSPPGDLNCIFCPVPTGQALKSYAYSIQVTSDSGCVAADTVNVFIECNDGGLLLPNAFTPNQDNLNEVFYPIGRGISLIKSFTIYNRYGQVVFSKKDFPPNDKSIGWDGRIKGEPANNGVYVYQIEAVCDLGQNIFKKGIVTLIR